MIYQLTKELVFPVPQRYHSSGIVALGGDLSPERLTLAYRSGIFPWFEDSEPITWYSPEFRMVLFLDELKVSKSMRVLLKKQVFTVTFNTCFEQVIKNCQSIKRTGQLGTWITDDMIQAYMELHRQGLAKSVEVWQGKELVGGLYGIDLGHIFCGESMFSKVPNASKIAFISLVEKLKTENYKLLDCQVYNDHLASLGAREISRAAFLKML